MDTIPLIISLLAAAIAIVPALMRMESEKKKDNADVAGTLTTGAMSMVEKWERRVVALEQEVAALKQESEIWKAGCYLLIGQLVEIGHEPVWRPPTRRDDGNTD